MALFDRDNPRVASSNGSSYSTVGIIVGVVAVVILLMFMFGWMTSDPAPNDPVTTAPTTTAPVTQPSPATPTTPPARAPN